MICGESNVYSTGARGDNHQLNKLLSELGIRIVLSPVHDRMSRSHLMSAKRAYYSANRRTVISVWNSGKRGESSLPWTVFHDGQDLTNDRVVTKVEGPVPERPDVRIGILDLTQIQKGKKS